MSWKDRVDKKMVITTGDGESWTVDWKPSVKDIKYNSKSFDFPYTPGSLVDRREVSGIEFDLEFYFQGAEYLTETDQFEVSARDKRSWNIDHPLYGFIIVQPLSLKFDNSKFNVTKITGVVKETIDGLTIRTQLIPEDRINDQAEICNDFAADNFSNDVDPNGTDVNDMLESNLSTFSNSKPIIDDATDSEEFFNTLKKADAAVRVAFSDANSAIREMQNLIIAPARFKQSIAIKLQTLTGNLSALAANLLGVVTSVPISTRRLYESTGASTLSAMAISTISSTNTTRFINRREVSNAVDIILSSYAEYTTNINNLQVGTGGSATSYIPNANTITALNDLINYTISNLYNIGFNAKQERVYVVNADTNVINLTHKIYGMDQNDDNIDTLMDNNAIGLSEILNIKKGREILYYV